MQDPLFKYYYLNGKEPIPCDWEKLQDEDSPEVKKWVESCYKAVATDEVICPRHADFDPITIVTHFLGFAYHDEGVPKFFDQWIVSSDHLSIHLGPNQKMPPLDPAFATWEEAEQSHKELVEEVRTLLTF